jgi:hypothetical protein
MTEPFLPLPTDADLLAMARELVGAANQRQTWLFVLDHEQRCGEAIILEGVPVDPDPVDVATLAVRLTELVEGLPDAESVVLVWERHGSAEVRMQEADWIAGLAASGAPVRAQLLASDDGVHLVDPAFAALVAG